MSSGGERLDRHRHLFREEQPEPGGGEKDQQGEQTQGGKVIQPDDLALAVESLILLYFRLHLFDAASDTGRQAPHADYRPEPAALLVLNRARGNCECGLRGAEARRSAFERYRSRGDFRHQPGNVGVSRNRLPSASQHAASRVEAERGFEAQVRRLPHQQKIQPPAVSSENALD